MLTAVKRNERVRALARRAGVLPRVVERKPPARPIGVKLELTYACNLRCAFCYTDSPRHTLARTPELSDADWLRITEDAIELGVIEAVVTGGEPLLRADLALDVLERLSAARLNLSLNTNGWFIDEAMADRLAAIDGLRVHVSLDGPTAEIHERSRGVPGSWRRAVHAIALLADRGVRVEVVHVVTPDNEHVAPEMVEQAWTLGADALRVVTVVPIGAAARGRAWEVHGRNVAKQVEDARARIAPDLRLRVLSDFRPSMSPPPPRSLLVRPNGNVRTDSISPFRFGHALEDGLAECWARIARDWDDPRVRDWQRPIAAGKVGLAETKVVPYRDEEIAVGESRGDHDPAADALPQPTAATQVAGTGDADRARAHVTELGLRRRYRLADVRWTDADAGGRYVRLPDTRVMRLNATAAIVMDACAEGSAADAVARLAERFPEMPRKELESAALGTARRLADGGVLSPALR